MLDFLPDVAPENYLNLLQISFVNQAFLGLQFFHVQVRVTEIKHFIFIINDIQLSYHFKMTFFFTCVSYCATIACLGLMEENRGCLFNYLILNMFCN